MRPSRPRSNLLVWARSASRHRTQLIRRKAVGQPWMPTWWNFGWRFLSVRVTTPSGALHYAERERKRVQARLRRIRAAKKARVVSGRGRE
jgi:hypothetical protein